MNHKKNIFFLFKLTSIYLWMLRAYTFSDRTRLRGRERGIAVNFTSLRYFLVTAEELNITHAASRLYISQQALSGHIGKLEQELGVPLFNRTPALSLTSAGRELRDYAVRVTDLERQIRQVAEDIADDRRGELRIGISHTCGRAILPSILPDFRRAHPQVSLVLQESTSRTMEESLLRGDLDLMIDFTPIQAEGAEYEELIRERLFLVVPRAMLEANYGACCEAIRSECARELDLALFARFPFILLRRGNRVRSMLDGYMRRVGFAPDIVLETENVETALALAERGMGVTTYPELFRWCIPGPDERESPVEFFPFRDEETTGTLAIAWMRGHYQTRAAREFVLACREAVSAIREKQRSV